MSTGTTTTTYTTVDVGKVVDRFAADLGMAAQSTGLIGVDMVVKFSHDIKLMAQRKLVDRVDIVLTDVGGRVLRAVKYEASTEAGLWTCDRPGDMLWPRSITGRLTPIVHYTEAWDDMGADAQDRFKRDECQISWSPSSIDTSYPGMSATAGRRYASSDYGMERTDYRTSGA